VAYVPEDNLISPSPADKDALQHPFIYLLFSGMGADGSYIPTRALRERYDVERRDIYPDEDVKDESNEQ